MRKEKTLGEKLKEQGQQQVLWGESEDFLTRLVNMLRDWCFERKQSGKPKFRLEEFRVHCEAQGVSPNHYNTWGAITKRYKQFSSFMVKTDETQKSERPQAKARATTVWCAI